MISDTKFMKTVSDRRTVTSAKAPINTKLEISVILKLLKNIPVQQLILAATRLGS